MLFIDFKQAFAKIKRNCIVEALKAMQIPLKLRKLIRGLRCTYANVQSNRGVRQGDTLPETLFNVIGVYLI